MPPVTEKHKGGTMTLSDLCAATMIWSDNSASYLTGSNTDRTERDSALAEVGRTVAATTTG